MTAKDRYVIEARGRPSGAYLYRFPVDSAELQTEHRRWLDSNIVGAATIFAGVEGASRIITGGLRGLGDLIDPAGRRVDAGAHEKHIWIGGFASRTGGFAHNLDLSQQRVAAVRDYLRGRLLPSLDISIRSLPFGEAAAFVAGHENNHESAAFRSVYVEFSATKPPRPPIPKRVPKVEGPKWTSLRLWLDVDFIDLGVVRRMNGDLVGSINHGFRHLTAWHFTGTSVQAGIPGLPSVGLPSNLKTAAVDLEFDPKVFDPEAAFSKKVATIRTHGKTVKMMIVGVLDRMPTASHQPIKGHRTTDLELTFKVAETLDNISAGGVTLGRARDVIRKNTA